MKRHVARWRLTVIGVPAITAAAYFASGRLGYAGFMLLLSACALGLADSYIAHVFRERQRR